MNRFLVRPLLPILCGLLLISSTGQAVITCQQVTKSQVQKPFEKKVSYRLLNYNLENLGDPESPTEMQNYAGERRKQKNGKRDDLTQKNPEELQKLRKFLVERDPDFATFQEVESVRALRDLIEGDPVLKDKYFIFLKEGNDARGIDVGFIAKKSLGFRYKLESHKGLTRTFKVSENGRTRDMTGPLFSRDFPILLVFVPGSDVPVFLLGGMHAKSKRTVYSSDPESVQWRTAQLNAKADILTNTYEPRFGKVRMAVSGDSNTEIQFSKEAEKLRQVTTSAFDMVPKAGQIPPNKRVTHSFFPMRGSPKYNQIDDIRFRNMPEGSVVSAKILRDLDKNGQEINLPQSFKERQKQRSDHFAQEVEFKIFD